MPRIRSSASLPAPRPGAGRARQRAQPFQHGHVLQQVQQLDGDPQRFPAPGGQELGVAPPPHLGTERRHLHRPAVIHHREGVAAHLVRDHVGGHARVRVAQFPANMPDQLRRLPAVPPRRRDGKTQEAGDLPADGLRPAGRLLRRQQLEVLRETALVTAADGIDRRAHRGHDELPLRRNSLPARRPAQARRPLHAAALALLVLLLPPVTAGFPHDANLRELRPRRQDSTRCPQRGGGHAEDAPIHRGAPRWGCLPCGTGVTGWAGTTGRSGL